MISNKLLKFGSKFSDRLDASLIDGAMNYISHGENRLAFEIMCDNLCEYEIRIRREEYEEAIELGSQLGVDTNTPPFRYLRDLLLIKN
ncbi:MafI family immunity protein [Xanthomonas campestris pv. pennamericanum]|uniref:MafI family immunity protein n=1 Tax=Xanthomonas euvesicatoria TaxID=456327 RepID=UPI001C4381C2|nr:MafI family immunity protein [Xanthomonas euvesicatoria]MBV6810621.1 MafI family immunity protein [Xanthomonas campestris pv. pennamericanum]